MISVHSELKVNVRCQFKSVPGVTHITLWYSNSRDGGIYGHIEMYGATVSMDASEISSSFQGKSVGIVSMFKSTVANELMQGIREGVAQLNRLKEATK